MTKHHHRHPTPHLVPRCPSNRLSVRIAVAAVAFGVALGILFMAIVVWLNPLP
jgi:hypothetical protein